jgi:hypothetical protein
LSDAEFYRENGYLHCRGVFEEGEVEEMRSALDRVLAAVEGTAFDENHAWAGGARESVLKGFHNVQYHDAAFTRAATHPRLVSVLTELIGPNVQLHHTKMLVKPPEQGAPCVEGHVNWGQGLMVAGRNELYWQTRPQFEIKA